MVSRLSSRRTNQAAAKLKTHPKDQMSLARCLRDPDSEGTGTSTPSSGPGLMPCSSQLPNAVWSGLHTFYTTGWGFCEFSVGFASVFIFTIPCVLGMLGWYFHRVRSLITSRSCPVLAYTPILQLALILRYTDDASVLAQRLLVCPKAFVTYLACRPCLFIVSTTSLRTLSLPTNKAVIRSLWRSQT
jgi:hypothetical protein